jgi:hypothetical protein
VLLLRRRIAVAAALLLLGSRASAQGTPTDHIRGKVSDDSNKVVVGATVFVTRGPDRAFKQTTTDAEGRYTVDFENGTGDYLIAVSAVGYKNERRRIQKQSDEHDFTANFILGHDASQLAAVKVTAQKPARATPTPASPYNPETGAAEKWSDGVAGQLSPTLAGNIAATAGMTPGITQGPGGLSMLGASSESNLTTMNGMAMGSASIPRAARVDTRVTGATFDPTRGGFSGANLDVRLPGGDRNFQQRTAFLTLDPQSFQATDAVGRALGARNDGLKGSAGANGELIRRAMTYNIAVDLARNTSEPATLLRADPLAFLRAGISADSAARVIATANSLGIPLAGAGVPSARRRDAVSWIGRIDDTRDSLDVRALTTYLTNTSEGALNFGALSAPAAGGTRQERTMGAMLQANTYFGDGLRLLNITKASVSRTQTESAPYRALPGASVLVRSAGADGALSSVSLGGSSFLASDDERWTAEVGNETIWNAEVRRHTFKLFGWGRVDGVSTTGGADLLGRYSYNSIADLAAGRPASFSRTLSQPTREGTVWNGAAAIAHQFTPSRWLSVLYGARVEANGFASAPAKNAALESALGVPTGAAPTLFHVSPRVGFSYTYNRDKNNGNGMSNNMVGSFYRTTAGVIKGGIGEFRDLLKPDLLADAASRTGLARSTQTLSCVGAAVPIPDWTKLVNDPSSAPSRCADGSGALGESAPPATLIARDYEVPRSWRASVDWNSSRYGFLVRASALGSYDLNQSGVVDANFGGTSRFTLANEAARPVFVSPTSIDGASGAVSATEARKSPAYGRVGVRTGDLKGYGGQLTLQLQPDVFARRRIPGSPYLSVAYTLQSTRRQFRGFDGAAWGDPRALEWAPGPNDARHIYIVQSGFYTDPTGAWTFSGRFQSGLPFTPLVQGDVNGDGRGGDRAFVPDANTTTDASLATQLRSLASNGSPAARACLAAYAGRVADRNGCRAPWTATLNAQWQPPMPSSWRRRLTASVFFENVLGGLDQWLHGSDGLRGWGGQFAPDPVLLVPRGFNATTKAFAYDVNPRFAETRPSRTGLRNPFKVTIDFSFNLSTDYDLQELRRALEPVRAPDRSWQRRSADSLAAFYLGRTSDIFKSLLQESDSLFLIPGQIAALRRADSAYSAQVRAIYIPLGQYLSQFKEGEAPKEALDSTQAATKRYWKVFWKQPEIADSLITTLQKELMPMLKSMVQVPTKDREHSQWYFGNPVKFSDAAPPDKPTGNVQINRPRD